MFRRKKQTAPTPKPSPAPAPKKAVALKLSVSDCLQQAQNALRKLRGLNPGDLQAFPLLNEIQRLVQQLREATASLPPADRDAWSYQITDLEDDFRELADVVVARADAAPKPEPRLASPTSFSSSSARTGFVASTSATPLQSSVSLRAQQAAALFSRQDSNMANGGNAGGVRRGQAVAQQQRQQPQPQPPWLVHQQQQHQQQLQQAPSTASTPLSQANSSHSYLTDEEREVLAQKQQALLRKHHQYLEQQRLAQQEQQAQAVVGGGTTAGAAASSTDGSQAWEHHHPHQQAMGAYPHGQEFLSGHAPVRVQYYDDVGDPQRRGGPPSEYSSVQITPQAYSVDAATTSVGAAPSPAWSSEAAGMNEPFRQQAAAWHGAAGAGVDSAGMDGGAQYAGGHAAYAGTAAAEQRLQVADNGNGRAPTEDDLFSGLDIVAEEAPTAQSAAATAAARDSGAAGPSTAAVNPDPQGAQTRAPGGQVQGFRPAGHSVPHRWYSGSQAGAQLEPTQIASQGVVPSQPAVAGSTGGIQDGRGLSQQPQAGDVQPPPSTQHPHVPLHSTIQQQQEMPKQPPPPYVQHQASASQTPWQQPTPSPQELQLYPDPHASSQQQQQQDPAVSLQPGQRYGVTGPQDGSGLMQASSMHAYPQPASASAALPYSQGTPFSQAPQAATASPAPSSVAGDAGIAAPPIRKKTSHMRLGYGNDEAGTSESTWQPTGAADATAPSAAMPHYGIAGMPGAQGAGTVPSGIAVVPAGTQGQPNAYPNSQSQPQPWSQGQEHQGPLEQSQQQQYPPSTIATASSYPPVLPADGSLSPAPQPPVPPQQEQQQQHEQHPHHPQHQPTGDLQRVGSARYPRIGSLDPATAAAAALTPPSGQEQWQTHGQLLQGAASHPQYPLGQPQQVPLSHPQQELNGQGGQAPSQEPHRPVWQGGPEPHAEAQQPWDRTPQQQVPLQTYESHLHQHQQNISQHRQHEHQQQQPPYQHYPAISAGEAVPRAQAHFASAVEAASDSRAAATEAGPGSLYGNQTSAVVGSALAASQGSTGLEVLGSTGLPTPSPQPSLPYYTTPVGLGLAVAHNPVSTAGPGPSLGLAGPPPGADLASSALAWATGTPGLGAGSRWPLKRTNSSRSDATAQPKQAHPLLSARDPTPPTGHQLPAAGPAYAAMTSTLQAATASATPLSIPGTAGVVAPHGSPQSPFHRGSAAAAPSPLPGSSFPTSLSPSGGLGSNLLIPQSGGSGMSSVHDRICLLGPSIGGAAPSPLLPIPLPTHQRAMDSQAGSMSVVGPAGQSDLTPPRPSSSMSLYGSAATISAAAALAATPPSAAGALPSATTPPLAGTSSASTGGRGTASGAVSTLPPPSVGTGGGTSASAGLRSRSRVLHSNGGASSGGSLTGELVASLPSSAALPSLADLEAFLDGITGPVDSCRTAAEQRARGIVASLGGALSQTQKVEAATQQQRRTVKAALAGVVANIRQLEADQAAAVEGEDFDTAAALDEQLTQLLYRRTHLDEQDRTLASALQRAAALRLEVLGRQSEAWRVTGAYLARLQGGQQQMAAALAAQAEREAHAATMLHRAAQEALAQRRTALEQRHEELREAYEEVAARVAAATAPAEAERKRRAEVRDMLQAEVESLRALLAAKEAALADAERSVADAAAAVRQQAEIFDGEMATLQEARGMLRAEEAQVASQDQAVQESECQAAARVAAVEEHQAQLRQQAELLGAAAAGMRGEAEALAKRVEAEARGQEQRERLLQADEAAREDLRGLERCIADLSSDLSRLAEQRGRLATERAAAQEGLAGLQRALPELEAAKRAAAANKDFREAARLSGELRALTVQADVASAQLSRLSSALSELVAVEGGKVSELEELRAMVHEAQRRAAEAHHRYLVFSLGLSRVALEEAAAAELYEEAGALQTEVSAGEAEALALERTWGFTRPATQTAAAAAAAAAARRRTSLEVTLPSPSLQLGASALASGPAGALTTAPSPLSQQASQVASPPGAAHRLSLGSLAPRLGGLGTGGAVAMPLSQRGGRSLSSQLPPAGVSSGGVLAGNPHHATSGLLPSIGGAGSSESSSVSPVAATAAAAIAAAPAGVATRAVAGQGPAGWGLPAYPTATAAEVTSPPSSASPPPGSSPMIYPNIVPASGLLLSASVPPLSSPHVAGTLYPSITGHPFPASGLQPLPPQAPPAQQPQVWGSAAPAKTPQTHPWQHQLHQFSGGPQHLAGGVPLAGPGVSAPQPSSDPASVVGADAEGYSPPSMPGNEPVVPSAAVSPATAFSAVASFSLRGVPAVTAPTYLSVQVSPSLAGREQDDGLASSVGSGSGVPGPQGAFSADGDRQGQSSGAINAQREPSAGFAGTQQPISLEEGRQQEGHPSPARQEQGLGHTPTLPVDSLPALPEEAGQVGRVGEGVGGASSSSSSSSGTLRSDPPPTLTVLLHDNPVFSPDQPAVSPDGLPGPIAASVGGRGGAVVTTSTSDADQEPSGRNMYDHGDSVRVSGVVAEEDGVQEGSATAQEGGHGGRPSRTAAAAAGAAVVSDLQPGGGSDDGSIAGPERGEDGGGDGGLAAAGSP